MRVLIADDHIPDDTVPDDGIERALIEAYGSATPEHVEKVRFMRKLVTALRECFDVEVCNRAAQVPEAIGGPPFAAAVIDLGWYADLEVPREDRAFKGWDLIAAVRAKDEHLPLIMCSSRMSESDRVARGAVERGVLPFHKRYDDPCIPNLEATIRFVARNARGDVADRVRQIDLDTYTSLATLTRVLFLVALVFFAVGLGLVLGGVVAIGVLTGGLSLVTSIMSGLFWKYLRAIRQDLIAR